MADRSRDEKLAAAKKRLKKYQQKSEKGKTKKQKNSNAFDSSKESEDLSKINGSLPNALESIENSFDFVSDEVKNDVSDTKLEPTTPVGQPAEVAAQELEGELDCDGRTANGSPTASTERILQLSRHLNGIISDTEMSGAQESSAAAIRDLEARNVELAALLEKRNHTNEQLSVQLAQLRESNQRLQQQFASERSNSEATMQRDLAQAREQVAAHLQTVGILVAEKSQLQSQLLHSQRLAQQRLQEIEEASARLRASKSKVDELETSISSSRESSAGYEAQRREMTRELDRLRSELTDAQQAKEDLAQYRDELQQRLQQRTQECAAKEKAAGEAQKKLELANIYIEQLSSGRDSDKEAAIARLHRVEEEKEQLQARLGELQAALAQLTDERDRLANQYREYIQQLQSQGQQLQGQVDDLAKERDALLGQVADLDRLLKESRQRAERLEQANRSERVEEPSEGKEAVLEELQQAEKEKAVLECALAELRSRDSSLSAQLEELATSNRRLNALLEERELERMSLQDRLDQASEERGDRQQLLAEMQSDKTALSRALAQNRELKLQMVELEASYVQTTQNHMEITTKWQHEQHVSKELATRLQQQESELKEVRELLLVKEEELRGLKQSYYTVTQQMFDLESSEERKQAMHAQTGLVEKLQKELNSAQDTINSLTSQNSELRTLVYQAQAVMSKEAPASPAPSRSRTTSSSSSNRQDPRQEASALQASVAQLQMERDQLMTECEAANEEAAQLRAEVDSLRPASHEGKLVTAERFAELQQAQEQLEEKFNAAMQNQAALRDQNEYLEHLVMQLEGETATIADYIGVYQRARLALKERERQKARDLHQLDRERQMLQAKLGRLQGLVLRLLQEKEGSAQLTDHLTAMELQDADGADDWPSLSSTSSDSDEDDRLPDGPLSNGSSPSLSVHRSSRKLNGSSSQPSQLQASSIAEHDDTAKQIISLISELGVQEAALPTLAQDINYFRPCKCCTGKLQLV